MSQYKILLSILLCFSCFLDGVAVAAETTTVYLVRHTEKDLSQKSDPPLTEVGRTRANQWASLLQHEEIAAVFSTDTIRTRDTAAPIAAHYKLEVALYPAKTVTKKELLEGNNGKAIVVVGHSNTVPSIVNMLIGEERYSDLSEEDYDSLFIVDITSDSGKSVASSKHLKVPLAE